MTKITNAALIAACEQMLTENIAYTTLDCQAAVEEALRRAGVPLSECNLGGSNAHYRNCLWRGTPERMLDLLGAKEVPAGMFTFIVEAESSSTPAKYRGDGYGDATHMGVYIGSGRTFNSSEKNGGVVVSTKFNGKKQAVSGSWNMVGWAPWVDCGLTDAQVAALTGDANYTGGGGGYTITVTALTPVLSNSYPVEIGAGGTGGGYTGTATNGGRGGTTSAFGSSAPGGYGGIAGPSAWVQGHGGNGGSGGGSAGNADVNAPQANGGSNGGNGQSGMANGGTGQGTTTREFGEESGQLYAGGGGGCFNDGSTPNGGAGGGGSGHRYNDSMCTAGQANTGGGGGGGYATNNVAGKAGGSGIVVIRDHR